MAIFMLYSDTNTVELVATEQTYAPRAELCACVLPLLGDIKTVMAPAASESVIIPGRASVPGFA